MKASKNAHGNKDTTKRRLKIIRFYPIFMYHKLDVWLSEMSFKGWHIVDCGIFVFSFERGKPEERKYFTYAEFSPRAKYSLTLLHPFFEKLYGLNSKLSKINSNKSKKYQILEIDIKSIQNNIGFNELVNDRNQLYRRYCLINYGITFIVVVFIVLLRILFNAHT